MNELIGIPYVNKGTSVRGVDCWGLIVLYHELVLGREIPRYGTGYDDAESQQAWSMIQAGWVDWERVPPGQEQKGDVLAFRGLKTPQPTHCGVVVGAGRFLHCLRGRATCIENYDRGMWKSLLVRIGRWNS
jgi:cell wall-associated NlpC family hydrolase